MNDPRPRKQRYGSGDWTHRSVHALMDGLPATSEPADVVRTQARELIARARRFGWTGPPFDPVVFAELNGIKAREGTPELAQDALIHPLTSGELEIVWSPSATPGRRNFSIFHEVGHTIFPDCYETVRYRRDREHFDPDRELETLCDLAAAEMLMPEPEFPRDLQLAGGFGADAIESLVRGYCASREAVARRAVGLEPTSCVAVFLSLRHKPADRVSSGQNAFDFYEAPAPKLRVDYCVASPTLTGLVFPRHKSIPDESSAYEVLSSGLSSTGRKETWTGVGTRLLNVSVDSMMLSPDQGGRPRVLALVRPFA